MTVEPYGTHAINFLRKHKLMLNSKNKMLKTKKMKNKKQTCQILPSAVGGQRRQNTRKNTTKFLSFGRFFFKLRS